MKKLLGQHIDKGEEDVFVFLLSDRANIERLKWESDDEFTLDGKMYDVIEKKTDHGKLIIRSISDKKETSLVKKYETLTKENNSKTRTAFLVKLVSSSYLATSHATILIKNIAVPSTVSFQPQIVSSPVHDVLTPPPQVS
jgi:NAD-specific glutamate dehydrogenase